MGPLPVLKTLRDKEPFSLHGGIQERAGDCPMAGRRRWVMRVSGSAAAVLAGLTPFIPFQRAHNRRAYSQDFLLGLVHRFWFIVSE